MLNERIKSLRIALNYSQVDLAEKLSVSRQAVSNWENDNIQPSIDMLVRIAQLFGVSTDYMLGLENTPRVDVSGLSLDAVEHINLLINDIRAEDSHLK